MYITRRASQIDTARLGQGVLGTRWAAEFLRLRGWSLEAALYILLGIEER